jgi:pimeloyl-ACP methyl ester carboxylesterase
MTDQSPLPAFHFTTGFLSSLVLAFICVFAPTLSAATPDHVILLHGLARTSASMAPLENTLRDAGYIVHNVDYPSRTAPVDKLAEKVIGDALVTARKAGAVRIHFVTHSLGGILVRSYLTNHRVPELGRVVMLGPPNQGSEVVDRIGSWWLFQKINGPAGGELGTGATSAPNKLGPVTYPVGVIAGSRSINGINSLMIPGIDDGKVSIERTQVAGMADHIVVAASHPYLMKNPAAIRQVLQFLANGAFAHEVGNDQ